MYKSALRLKEMRWSQKITQRKLADDIGVHASVLSRIEQGRSKCGELLSRRLGDYFMCDWRYFMSED